MNNKGGFTLIELLTVISIVAILSAITLVTFPAATSRAKDARIINAMQQLRTAAEVSKGNEGNYAQVKCSLSTDTTILALVAEVTTNGGTCANWPAAPTTAYCLTALLNSTKYWCIDSTLRSQAQDTVGTCTGTGTTCQ